MLKPDNITKLQQIIRDVLYYARDVDGNLITTINELASPLSKGSQVTMKATKKLMGYCYTHSDATIRYCASQMQLQIHRDASYLAASKARSRVVGHFFLSENFDSTSRTKHNGAVFAVAAILKHVTTKTER